MWRCPKCQREFTRKHQRHACGVGNSAETLRGRSPGLVAIYGLLESFIQSLGGVEIVARDRYVLFRTKRIFADCTIMTDAVRVVVHLDRKVDDPLFAKVGADRNKISHVAKVRTRSALASLKPYLKEAHAGFLSGASQ